MPRPGNVKDVRRFCGFVNYLARFLPKLSDVMDPLRQLTARDTVWSWENQQEIAFNRIKKMISTAPLLKYYDPNDELTIQCDASEKGLGAAIMQRGQPVAFASRALTDTETRYAQIEKEMLAVVFSLQKFEQYAYGRPVMIESDHKPLDAIVKKPLRTAPKRLQCMMLKIQMFDVTIVYKPRSKMFLADTLSRAYLPSSTNRQGEFESISAVKFLLITEELREKITRSTAEDEVMQELKMTILKGWPNEKQAIPPILAPYFSYRDELSVHDGLVFRGERLVIPKCIRPDMKKVLHSAHLGVNGCLRRARECMFWPNMNAELKQYILSCEVCNQHGVRQCKETLMPQEATERPWEKIGADLLTFQGKEYLILVDYFSNFWEIEYLRDTKAGTCIKKIKSHFARNGIPDVLISDNGPQFSSDKFATFSKEWGFEHKTSSPGHQQTNGKAEAAVKAAKNILRKASESHGDVYLAILAQRNTPTEQIDSSPAQRLLGRRTKTLLPITRELLKLKGVDAERITK